MCVRACVRASLCADVVCEEYNVMFIHIIIFEVLCIPFC